MKEKFSNLPWYYRVGGVAALVGSTALGVTGCRVGGSPNTEVVTVAYCGSVVIPVSLDWKSSVKIAVDTFNADADNSHPGVTIKQKVDDIAGELSKENGGNNTPPTNMNLALYTDDKGRVISDSLSGCDGALIGTGITPTNYGLGQLAVPTGLLAS